MKKTLATILLVVVLLATLTTISAFASTVPTFEVGTACGNINKTVQVDIKVKGNPGIASAKLSIAYDSDCLELVSVEQADFTTGVFMASPLEKNPITITWANVSNISNDGVIAKLEFIIKEGVQIGKATPITISYNPEDVFDEDWENVTFATANGGVTLHSFDKEVVADKYLKTAATCTAKAVYYKSCSCGEKGSATFTSGSKLAHTYSNACDATCNNCSAKRTPSPHRYTNDADTSCNVCNAFAYPGGNTLYKENGVWYHVVNRQKVSDTTMVKYSGSWYYVTGGKVASAYTGLVKYSGSWYYIQNGKMPTSYTGLVKHSGSWYYVQNSKMAASYTGLVKYSGSWYYIQNGKMPTSYNNLAKYSGSWYLVQGSKVNFTYKGLYKYNGSWYYVADGKINFSFSGKVLYSGKYYTVKNGVKV